MRFSRIFFLLPLLLALGACGADSWFGKSGDPVLPGKRQSVLVSDNEIKPDELIAETPVTLPPAVANRMWPMAGGFADHAMQNLALGQSPLKTVWQINIGAGSSKNGFLLSQPIVYGGRVYTMDADSEVRSIDLETGREAWDVDLSQKGSGDIISSGGLATDGQMIYATSGNAELIGISPLGKIVWRQPVSSPLRGAPTVADGKVLIIPVDNRLMALSAKEGLLQWMYEGLSESAALLGGSSAAASNGLAVVPFSTGDLIAFDLAKGKPVWSENLSRVRRGDLLATITSVRALPVIDQGRVYAMGHSDRTMALDLGSGDRIWDLPIGGIQTPWIADKYLYLIDNDSRLICIEAERGLIRWVRDLNQGAKKPGRFAGPVLAGGRLWVAGSQEKLLEIDPQNGATTASYDLPGPVSIAPVVADNTLLVMTDNGKLAAFR